MRNSTLLLLISLLFFISCKKNNDGIGDNSDPNMNGTIVKKWRLDAYQSYNNNTQMWGEVQKINEDCVVEFFSNSQISIKYGMFSEQGTYEKKDDLLITTFPDKNDPNKNVIENISIDKLTSTQLNISGDNLIPLLGDRQFYIAE